MTSVLKFIVWVHVLHLDMEAEHAGTFWRNRVSTPPTSLVVVVTQVQRGHWEAFQPEACFRRGGGPREAPEGC